MPTNLLIHTYLFSLWCDLREDKVRLFGTFDAEEGGIRCELL